jgi:hypothetical protein
MGVEEEEDDETAASKTVVDEEGVAPEHAQAERDDNGR